MKDQKNEQKPLIFYYITSLLLILLLNALIFPMFINNKVTEVDYGTFLKDIDNGKVATVQVEEEEKQIYFTEKGSDGNEKIFVTKAMNDPDLVNRLYNSKKQ